VRRSNDRHALGNPRREEPARVIELDGVSIEVPPRWDGYVLRIGAREEVTVIWAASTPFDEPSPPPEFPHDTLAALPEDGIAVEVVAQPPQTDSTAWTLLTPPLRLADGYFLADSYAGQPAPGVSTQIVRARVGGLALHVQVYFGGNRLDESMRRQANNVLSSLVVAATLPVREEREDGFVRFHDIEMGVSGRHPQAWHRARALTNFVSPREVLVLATYPLRDRADAGECAPDTARADMEPGGVFLWLLEYRPLRGDVWADFPRERFAPKPDRFELDRSDLGGNNSCFPGPTYRTSFRTADRPFDLLVAFGGHATDEVLDEAEAILNSLGFDELPPPPPDPYAGWPLVSDNSGDSFRPPPDWAAASAMYRPGKTPRPRPLFFASNRPLPGLPHRLDQHVGGLPAPFPDEAVAGFPDDGVLVWALEEEKGGISAAFPAIGRDWPAQGDFIEADAPTTSPGVSWSRAGGSFRGYRFSVWVAAGARAVEADLELALKSARSLAVSGCWRDRLDDCPDG
jgi:hypothetical protein